MSRFSTDRPLIISGLFLAFMLCLLGSRSAAAQGAAAVPSVAYFGIPDYLPELISRATLVVSGRIESLPSVEPTYPAGPRNIVFSVDRVIKGQYDNRQITLDLGLRPVPMYGHQAVGRYFVTFLIQSASGLGLATHDMLQFAPALPIDDYSTEPLETVQRMVAAAMVSPQSSPEDVALDITLLEGDRSGSDTVTKALEREVTIADQYERAETIAALVARRDSISFTAAEHYLDDPTALQNGKVPIINALGAVGDSSSVRLLVRQAHSVDPLIRLRILLALGDSESSEALPVCAAALDDAQEKSRYAAVVCLAKITRQDSSWGPVDDSHYRAHEALYLQYWKEWLKEHPVGKDTGGR